MGRILLGPMVPASAPAPVLFPFPSLFPFPFLFLFPVLALVHTALAPVSAPIQFLPTVLTLFLIQLLPTALVVGHTRRDHTIVRMTMRHTALIVPCTEDQTAAHTDLPTDLPTAHHHTALPTAYHHPALHMESLIARRMGRRMV
ncbi:hypothetical protein EC988_001968 [Linderina pennispora]|nr:hypothetical protein EC988_001968 [Linderina pennispora]